MKINITINPEDCTKCEFIELKCPNRHSPKQYFCRLVAMYLSTEKGDKSMEGTVPQQSYHCETLIDRVGKNEF